MECICIFSIQTLNNRIRDFKYSDADLANKPCPVLKESYPESDNDKIKN